MTCFSLIEAAWMGSRTYITTLCPFLEAHIAIAVPKAPPPQTVTFKGVEGDEEDALVGEDADVVSADFHHPSQWVGGGGASAFRRSLPEVGGGAGELLEAMSPRVIQSDHHLLKSSGDEAEGFETNKAAAFEV